MSNSNEIVENFETLKDLTATMSKAIEQLEQQQSKLEKDNKRLNDSNDVLLEITKKQRLMEGSSKESREDITNRFRVSINKKIDELRKEIFQDPIEDDFIFDENDPKLMLKLVVRILSLVEENKSLRDQASVFVNMHKRVMAEIRSMNSKNANSQIANKTNQQQGNSAMYAYPTTTSSLDQDDLQPLQVNVIDSDVDGLKDK